MTDDDTQLIHSPLTQTYSADGHTLQVEIYRGAGSHWILEVVDERGTSTVWDEQFETDTAALAAAFLAIEEEGIHHFVTTAQREADEAERGRAPAARHLTCSHRCRTRNWTCWRAGVRPRLDSPTANMESNPDINMTSIPGSHRLSQLVKKRSNRQFHALDKPEVDWLIQVIPGVFAQALNITRVDLIKAIRNREAQIRSE